MSLIGPRPEDPRFVELCLGDYAEILKVRPGITGLSQLAYGNKTQLGVDITYVVEQEALGTAGSPPRR